MIPSRIVRWSRHIRYGSAETGSQADDGAREKNESDFDAEMTNTELFIDWGTFGEFSRNEGDEDDGNW